MSTTTGSHSQSYFLLYPFSPFFIPLPTNITQYLLTRNQRRYESTANETSFTITHRCTASPRPLSQTSEQAFLDRASAALDSRRRKNPPLRRSRPSSRRIEEGVRGVTRQQL